jgi:outer membrane receptor protein involved in Fe transport
VKSRFPALLVLILAIASGRLGAQVSAGDARGSGGRPGFAGGVVSGRVVDEVAQGPLEYANIILTPGRPAAPVTGTITRKDGYFEVKPVAPGAYTLEVKFMGYDTAKLEDIRVMPPQLHVDVGTISLKRAVIPLEEVEVSAERPDVVFQIDKKVINVGKQFAATSGTAIDVLENVPSITVDIEGNVSLRGSSNFTVLLDGRPTMLEPSEVLQQIPASTIDNIEIVTNPSAKYDPDGISGIINVITKKSKLEGITGILNLNGGLDYKYGGDFLVSHKGEKVNTYASADYNRREFPGTYRSESRTYRGPVTSFIKSSGTSDWDRTMYSAKAGLDLSPSESDLLRFEIRGGRRLFERRADQDFLQGPTTGDDDSVYAGNSGMERTGDFYSGAIDYTHDFAREGHEITGQMLASYYSHEGEDFTELFISDGTIVSGRRSTEGDPSTRFRTDLDYVLPLREDERLEAGYQSRFDRMEEASDMYELDPISGRYELREDYSHAFDYGRDVHALYGLYSCERGQFGCQGGVRGEYTYRSMSLEGEDREYVIDRWDIFPTLHLSYEYTGGHQMMASYSRRIERTRSWYLDPFTSWSDAYNVRRGNPSLKPEYIDSYEMGYQKSFGRSVFSLEAYYRVTHDKVERVQSAYQPNVIMHSVENVGKDYTLGIEVMLNLSRLSWWNINLMGNLYDYRIEGTLAGIPLSEESLNWRTRINNTFRVASMTRIQINGQYRSPTASAQGEREGFYSTDAAVKQEFLNRALAVTLQVRDVFRTADFQLTSKGPDFFTHREFSRKSPAVTLTVSYNFNNYRREREQPEEREIFEGEEEF